MAWQERAVAAETNFETLSVKFQQQEAEIVCLRGNCSELTSLLEEFKSQKNACDVSVEWTAIANRRSLEGVTSAENLAHSVIDVQFKDVQKENSDLKNMLTESLNKIDALTEELKKANEDLLQKVCNSLQFFCSCLH